MKNLGTVILLTLCVTVLATTALAGQACRQFDGRFDGVVRGNDVAGHLSGDLSADVVGLIDAIGSPIAPMLVRGTTQLRMGRGTVKLSDQVEIYPVRGSRTVRWRGKHEIVGGSRAYRGATGYMYSRGTLDLETGRLSYECNGEICKPG